MTKHYLEVKVASFSGSKQNSQGHSIFSSFVYYVFYMTSEFYFSWWMPVILERRRKRRRGGGGRKADRFPIPFCSKIKDLDKAKIPNIFWFYFLFDIPVSFLLKTTTSFFNSCPFIILDKQWIEVASCCGCYKQVNQSLGEETEWWSPWSFRPTKLAQWTTARQVARMWSPQDRDHACRIARVWHGPLWFWNLQDLPW